MIFGSKNDPQFNDPKRWFAWRPIWLDDGRVAWREWVWYWPSECVGYPGLFTPIWTYSLDPPKPRKPAPTIEWADGATP